MDTDLKESPTVADLFDTSPTQEVTPKEETSPVKEVETEEKAEAVEEKSEEKSEEKESESESDDTSPDTDEEPSTEETTEDTRLKDAQKWGNEKNKEAIAVKAELTKLREEYGVEDTPIDDAEANARLEERIKTSEAIERKIHGDEFIQKAIYAEDSTWQTLKNDPIVDFRVRNADSPISEALTVIKEQEFHGKYGNDPDKIVEKIREELKPELMKELKVDYAKKLKDKNALGKDLSSVDNDKANGKDATFKKSSTVELFG